MAAMLKSQVITGLPSKRPVITLQFLCQMAFVEQVYSQLELNRVSLDPPPICEPRLPALA